MNKKIILADVTKQYDFHKTKSDKLRSFFTFRAKNSIPKFWALRGITLDIESGESVGLIGVNGSGKSTLSNIIAGIVPQTSGMVQVNGETSIISIGTGLKLELTGLENIKLKLLMTGLKNQDIPELMDDIIKFSELGDLIKQPVKSYSSGMRSRLGFSIAVVINPDIIIIDEALSVGDETFYQKCVNKMLEFKAQGKTIIFVSHTLPQIEILCDKTAWIHHGELKEFGDTKTVIKSYRNYINWYKNLNEIEKNEYLEVKKAQRMNPLLKISNSDTEYIKENKMENMTLLQLLMIIGLFVVLLTLFYIHLISF